MGSRFWEGRLRCLGFRGGCKAEGRRYLFALMSVSRHVEIGVFEGSQYLVVDVFYEIFSPE